MSPRRSSAVDSDTNQETYRANPSSGMGAVDGYGDPLGGSGGPDPRDARGAMGARTGPLAWWLNLTAPPRPASVALIAERERVRKAELTSFSIFVILAFLVALVSNSLADPGTARGVTLVAIVAVITAVLNRTRLSGIAAYLLPTVLMLVVAAAVLQLPGGLRMVGLPTYDLFVVPVFLVSLSGRRNATWLFAAAAIAFVVADFLLQPHALITAPGASGFDEIAYEVGIFGVWGMINRHVLVIFFAAFIGWLGARSVDGALRRADRAEEMAALEHSIAEQKRLLDIGIAQILQTHVRAANGDFSARASVRQENQLWQISSSLNNLLARMQRTAQAEHQLARTVDELRRIAAAIDDIQAGRQPIWPAPTGTPADLILDRIAAGQRRRSVQPPGGLGWPSGSSQPLGGSPFGPPYGPAPSSQPLPPTPYGQISSPQPLGQPPIAPRPGQFDQPPPSPWIVPHASDELPPGQSWDPPDGGARGQ
jgi:hypothetical protein